MLGTREERRLGIAHVDAPAVTVPPLTPQQARTRRPDRFWINAAVTVVVMAGMISGRVDPAAMFMIGTAAALLINYPSSALQRDRVNAHATAPLMMAAILLAAAAFTGIMKESGMLAAMASTAVYAVPASAAQHLPFLLGLVSMPLSLLFDPDSFYLGALPMSPGWRHRSGDRRSRSHRPPCWDR